MQLSFLGARNDQSQQEGDEEMPGHGRASSLTDVKKRKSRKREHPQEVLEEVEEGLQLVYMAYVCMTVSVSLQETQGNQELLHIHEHVHKHVHVWTILHSFTVKCGACCLTCIFFQLDS